MISGNVNRDLSRDHLERDKSRPVREVPPSGVEATVRDSAGNVILWVMPPLYDGGRPHDAHGTV